MSFLKEGRKTLAEYEQSEERRSKVMIQRLSPACSTRMYTTLGGKNNEMCKEQVALVLVLLTTVFFWVGGFS